MIVSPSGSLLRLKSSILEFSLLDSSLHFQDRAVPLENLRATVRKREEVPGSTDGGLGGDLGTAPPAPLGDQMILAVSCERGATCFSLPSQRQIYSYKSQDSQVNLTAQTVAWLGDKKSTSVLLLFTSEGRVKGEILQSVSDLTSLSLLLSSQSAALPASAGGLLGASHERQGDQDTEILHRRSRDLLLQSKPGQHHEKLAQYTVLFLYQYITINFGCIFLWMQVEVSSNILNIKRYSGSEVFRQQRGNQELE